MPDYSVKCRIVQHGERWRCTILFDNYMLDQEAFHSLLEAEAWCATQLRILRANVTELNDSPMTGKEAA